MTFTIKIADIPIEITCEDKETRNFFQAYLTDEPATIFIEVTPEEYTRTKRKNIELAAQKGLLIEDIAPWYVEKNAIHGLLANTLIDYDVLLVHGSAVVLDGEAYIFLADSGTGKSTHTRLWREAFGDRAWMLNDDKPMLRKTESGILVYGSPWDGKHHLSRNASAPLRALVKLSRSEGNSIEQMPKTDALAMLLEHAIRAKNAEKMGEVLQLETEIVNQVGTFYLACNMEPEAAIVAWQGITGRKIT